MDFARKGVTAVSWRMAAAEARRVQSLYGGTVTDILWSGSVLRLCISQRVIELLEENHFTGWSTYPVEVYGRKGEPLPGYHGFAIKSYAGMQDISRSQIVTKPPFHPLGTPWTAYRGFFFDESKWDGSDIFRVSGLFIVVTQRVKEAFKKARITNVMFEPLPEIEIDTQNYEYRNKDQSGKS